MDSLMAVEKLLHHLNGTDRRVVLLLMQGMTKKDVAEKIGVSRATLYRNHLPRIREKLEKIMKNDMQKRRPVG